MSTQCPYLCTYYMMPPDLLCFECFLLSCNVNVGLEQLMLHPPGEGKVPRKSTTLVCCCWRHDISPYIRIYMYIGIDAGETLPCLVVC